MKATCPKNPAHKRFVTAAAEMHDWLVDERGEFIEDKGCTEVLHKPESSNIWECADCGAQATVTYQ